MLIGLVALGIYSIGAGVTFVVTSRSPDPQMEETLSDHVFYAIGWPVLIAIIAGLLLVMAIGSIARPPAKQG